MFSMSIVRVRNSTAFSSSAFRFASSSFCALNRSVKLDMKSLIALSAVVRRSTVRLKSSNCVSSERNTSDFTRAVRSGSMFISAVISAPTLR